MNAATAPGQSQTVEQARERARQKAAQITEQMAVAKTAAAVRAILDTLPGANQVGELTPDDLARLTEHGQSLELDLLVEEGLAAAARSGEAPRALLELVAASPEPTPAAMTNKRAHIKRVLIRCGEFDLARARTVGLVTPFLGTKPKRWRKERTGGLLDGPQYHAENPDDTQEIRDHLKALADTRRRSIKRARRWFCLCSLILLFAGPVLVMLTKAPVTRLDIIPFNALFQFMSDLPIRYSTRYLPWAAVFALVRHPFMMAAVPISFAAILAANRIPGHGIAWIGALQGNWMAKLFAITAWIWLFTMILTHS